MISQPKISLSLFTFLISFSLLQGQPNDSLLVSPNNAALHYVGRINQDNPVEPVIYWAGTSIEMNFTGTSVKVLLDDEKGENYFQAIIDGLVAHPIVIHCQKGEKVYHLVAGLPLGDHHLELVKRTEPWEGSTTFKGFILDDNAKVVPFARKEKLQLVFFGNSITSGMGNEDLSANGRNNSNPLYKNHYLSYASVTARELNAEHHSISLSGIGITVSWGDYIMSEVYNRINPFDADSRCHFTSFQPDVVVVNLFQNDSWLVERPDYEQFKIRFPDGHKPTDQELVEAYVAFLKKIRAAYPSAPIVCALGSMDATREGSKWPGLVQQAVDKMIAGDKKEKITTFFFSYNGHHGHPTIYHDQQMGHQLATYIRKEVLTKRKKRISRIQKVKY